MEMTFSEDQQPEHMEIYDFLFMKELNVENFEHSKCAKSLYGGNYMDFLQVQDINLKKFNKYQELDKTDNFFEHRVVDKWKYNS